MDNMGGLQQLSIIDAADFVSLVAGENDLYTLTLDNGAVVTEIEFAAETGKISESEETADNGSVYNFEASCRIPKCAPGNADLLGDLKNKRIMVLGKDNNENLWLTGAPGSYFRISLSSDTGQGTPDINSRLLKISAELMTGSVFINTLT
jgi:hypothetical protein